MLYGLKRYQQSRQSHFATFSCSRRQPYLQDIRLRDLFLESLARPRQSYHSLVYGYVVMPEHLHLLVSDRKLLLGVRTSTT